MNFLIVGLGNPGEEYENTRHSVGRILLENFRKSVDFPDWQENKYAQALCTSGKIGKEKVDLILPETFMNKSGKSVSFLSTKNKIKPENIIVVYDDLDLPLGKFKISFNRGSGGHKGLESVARSLKTKEFVRLRVGISAEDKNGRARKPQGEKKVTDFILGKFKNPELEILKKLSKKTSPALEAIVSLGLEKAMGEWNSK